jgi:hypothetical protein
MEANEPTCRTLSRTWLFPIVKNISDRGRPTQLMVMAPRCMCTYMRGSLTADDLYKLVTPLPLPKIP